MSPQLCWALCVLGGRGGVARKPVAPPSLFPRPWCLSCLLARGTGGGDRLHQHRAGHIPGLLLEELDSGPRRLRVWAPSRPSAQGRTADRPLGASLTSGTRRRGWPAPRRAHSPREHQTQHGAEEDEHLVGHGRLRAQGGAVDVVLRDAAGQGHRLGPPRSWGPSRRASQGSGASERVRRQPGPPCGTPALGPSHVPHGGGLPGAQTGRTWLQCGWGCALGEPVSRCRLTAR